jgi:hypothetical protein
VDHQVLDFEWHGTYSSGKFERTQKNRPQARKSRGFSVRVFAKKAIGEPAVVPASMSASAPKPVSSFLPYQS